MKGRKRRRPASGRSRRGRAGSVRSQKWSNLETSVVCTLIDSSRRSLKAKELAKILEISGKEYPAFKKVVTDMEKRGIVHKVRGHRYAVPKSIELVRSTTGLTSLVSKYNQVIARADVKGIEANIPAIKLDLLAISEMATMIITVMIFLMTKYIT